MRTFTSATGRERHGQPIAARYHYRVADDGMLFHLKHLLVEALIYQLHQVDDIYQAISASLPRPGHFTRAFSSAPGAAQCLLLILFSALYGMPSHISLIAAGATAARPHAAAIHVTAPCFEKLMPYFHDASRRKESAKHNALDMYQGLLDSR